MRRILIIIISLASIGLYAQENTILFTHYTFNGLAINPAYSGSHEMLTVNLSHRTQWTGFEGAPKNNVFGLHTPFKNTRMGLGLLVTNQSMGLRKNTGIYINYAHRMTVGNGKLALGLKGGIGTGNMEALDLGDDIVFSKNDQNYLLPNFGVGVYYYSEKFYAGLSIPLLLGYTSNEGDIVANHDFSQYAYYLTTGVKIDVTSKWQIEPSALVQYSKPAGAILEGGFGVLYNDFVKAGLYYRNKQAMIAILDVKITQQLHAGIAYDYGTSEINTYNRNSFGIALEYNFGYKIKASNPTIF
jgi:type IX secretion system PorP/SprF family membrane protein